MYVSGREIYISGTRLWRIAVLTAAGTIGVASCAEAAVFWSDNTPGVSRPAPAAPQRRQGARHQAKKTGVPEKESAKPHGPLVIAISIEKQKLRIYDANGLFAETPISTGMKGHPTPMGVFSVIEKDRYHHSNIYSGAPMPFMQRITWSGVAMHAGVLPGYPASHGCIRMPMAFATKMWGWTKMGARVVVIPGEITPPENFSHPLLATEKVASQPVATAEPAPKSDKAADAGSSIKPTMSDGNAQAASTPLREQTHTADASASFPATKAPVTMSDANQSGGNTPAVPEQADVAAAKTDAVIIEEKSEAAASETAKSSTEPAAAKPAETASSEDRPVETAAADTTGQKPVGPAAVEAGGDGARTEAAAGESAGAEEPKAEAKTDDVKTSASVPDAPKAVEAKLPETKPVEAKPETKAVETTSIKSSDKPKAAADAAATPDAKKDQTRAPNAEKAAVKPDPAAAPKRNGQIAVFVSRKDAKLYVRQNFKPLFTVPVTIAPDNRPLGTHVFTAQVDKDDGNLLHWSVVSIPVSTRNAERRDEEERPSRRRKAAAVVEPKPMPVPDSPTEALDRLSIPPDAMTRIAEALSTGGSIIISDQGINAGETGEGTDFIVSLR